MAKYFIHSHLLWLTKRAASSATGGYTDNQVSKQRQKAIEMSSKEYGSAGLDPEFEEVEGDVIIDAQEVEEVVEDDGEEPMDEDYGDDNDEEVDAADMAAMAEEFEGNGVSVNAEGNLEIDLRNNSQSYFEDHQDSIFTVAAHPTLPIAVTGGGDNVGYMWTTHNNPAKTVTKLVGYGESVIASAFTSDGSYLVTGDMSGKVIVYKSSKKGQQWDVYDRVLEDVEEVMWLKTHPKQNVFAFGGIDGSVSVYSIEPSLELIFSGYSHSTECTNGAFVQVDDMDVLKLVTCSEDGSIIGWNCYTQQTDFKLDSTSMKGLTPPWVSIAVYSDSKVVALGSRDSQVAILNAENGALLTMFTALEIKEDGDIYDASIEAISWCEVLNLMVVGFVSGDVLIFDTNTWKVRRALKCGDAVTKITFLPKSPIFLVSSMDGKVYKWDARTGELLHECLGHHMGVLDFSVDCSGERLITAGDDGVSLVFKF
jgi:ribosome assembly protein SQT1